MHHIMFSVSRTPVNAVVIGEKLSLIEFHAARGSGVSIGISVAAFPSPLGGLHSRAAAFTDFKRDQNKYAKDAKDYPNYTPETAACVFVHTSREIPAFLPLQDMCLCCFSSSLPQFFLPTPCSPPLPYRLLRCSVLYSHLLLFFRLLLLSPLESCTLLIGQIPGPSDTQVRQNLHIIVCVRKLFPSEP